MPIRGKLTPGMATYAVGDIQGCFLTLLRLLDAIRFDPPRDTLWLVGDLVNRGPRSVEVLRWARGLGESVVTVLGNHDLHLLERALGSRKAKPGDTVGPVLEAPDGAELIGWLRTRPLLHREGRYLLVHAGLQPGWGVEDALAAARDVEAAIAGPDAPEVLSFLHQRDVPAWGPMLSRTERHAIALRTFVLMRTCRADGRLCGGTGPPGEASPGCRPWFDHEPWRSGDATVVCGHWAALGLRLRQNLLAIDTGCVWGGQLTAVRLEDRALFQVGLVD
jgi:bis(5'-nucleosyl)-tetraphosphatase (symmetrical)